ncbi:MAG TPA: CBS domain-containing protein [Chloroflexota bacterium]|nr:CBS domain-containing protein [Chloroflexota bacterium]
MQVSDLMTRQVITVQPETPVAEIARAMVQHDVSGVPVVDHDGNLVGIVTETDLVVQNANVHFPTFLQILDARIYLSDTRHFEDELRKALGTVAADVMTREVETVKPNDDVSVAATLMVDKDLNPIPVVENGKLVGIISRSDIIRHILAQETERSGP